MCEQNNHHGHDHEHPRDRAPAADDPMLLGALQVDGDPQVLLDSIIEEYARMGWGEQELLSLFDQPFFIGTHGLLQSFGREAVRQRITDTLRRCGVLRVSVVEVPVEAEEETITPTVRGQAARPTSGRRS